MKRRASKQRDLILDILCNTDLHPTADLIYDEVRKVMPHISKGTVYRNLNILCEDKKISILSLDGHVNRYEGNLDNHYHFRCQKCGRVFDLDEPVRHELNEKVSKSTGFEVLYHQLEFMGICKECQGRNRYAAIAGR